MQTTVFTRLKGPIDVNVEEGDLSASPKGLYY